VHHPFRVGDLPAQLQQLGELKAEKIDPGSEQIEIKPLGRFADG
jgi:hypothetical protein